FFHGVNNLKLYGARIIDHDPSAAMLAQRTLDDFEHAYNAAVGSGFFFEVARQSCQIFEGISKVYLSQFEEALNKFKLAAQGPYPGLKSRAYNDIGYVGMITGELASAQKAFTDALNTEGTFPTARVNLAYVEMALGNYDVARSILEKA